ncbi:uncharacterized protein LOC142219574 [Haematobia irritans]|uniref:uncharacterized protein LOC142219574 n=1 Tax=Haematobia irritans TaxID=7368 RepID=UPI003F50D0B1
MNFRILFPFYINTGSCILKSSHSGIVLNKNTRADRLDNIGKILKLQPKPHRILLNMDIIKWIFIFLSLVLWTDICAAIFLKPLIKSLKRSLWYGASDSSYGYHNSYPYGYNNYNSYGYHYGGGGGSSRYGSYYRPNKRGGGHRTGRTYTDIAKVINANPYAFVGSRPFPAQPFYPIGG